MKNNVLPVALLLGGGFYLFRWLKNKQDAGANLRYEPVDIAIDTARSQAASFFQIYYNVKIRLINDGRASVVVRDIDLFANAGNTRISNITSSTQFSIPANTSKVIQLTASISTAGIVNTLLNIIEDGLNIPVTITGQILTDLGTLNVSFTKVIGAPSMSAPPLFLNDKYVLYWKKNIQPTGNKLKNVYQYMLNSINTGAKVNEFEIQTESGASIPGAVFLNEVQFMNFEPKSFRAN
jgi:hypothetical protein